jgi:hypothetical protein
VDYCCITEELSEEEYRLGRETEKFSDQEVEDS